LYIVHGKRIEHNLTNYTGMEGTCSLPDKELKYV